MSSVQILGLADLQADFTKLAKSQSTKALRRATLAGAKVIRDEARARAPKKTGKLKRNIVMKDFHDQVEALYAGAKE